MTTFGIDFASMDGDQGANFAAARAAGVRFVSLRRSFEWVDGRGVVHLARDSSYADQAAKARAAGMVVQSYMFPALQKGAPDAATQVANFMAGGGDILPGVDLPPALDVEFSGRGIVEMGYGTESECQVAVLPKIAAIVAELHRVLGVYPMIYSSHVQMHDTNGLGIGSHSDAASIATLSRCALWIKTPYRLGAGQPLDQVAARFPHFNDDRVLDPNGYWRVPTPWQASGWVMQQTQGDAHGIAGIRQADVSRFNTLSRGNASSDPLVGYYKSRLGIRDWTSTWTDEFDAQVRGLQAAKKLDVDAVIGPVTAAAILWLS